MKISLKAIKTIKNIFGLFGLDVIRASQSINNIFWIKNHDINTVIDIGANTGQFAEEIRQILPMATIHSFEPIKACYEEMNTKRKADKKFLSYNVAIGDKNEDNEIIINSSSACSSVLRTTKKCKDVYPALKEKDKEKITIKRLDDLMANINLRKNILTKIDVQGYEKKVIDGGRETLKKSKVIFIENCYESLYEGQFLFNDIYKELTLMGFKYKGSFNVKKDELTGLILYEDSIFIQE